MSTEKDPFEKIRSLVERRKLFQSLIETGGEVVCKADGDALFTFIPISVAEAKLSMGTTVLTYGILNSAQSMGAKPQLVLGHFTVEPDRYFIKGILRSTPRSSESLYELDAESDIFKLQRRKTLRVQLPPAFPIYFRVRSYNGMPLELDVKLADISVGGMKIYSMDYELPFKDGVQVTGVLYPPAGRGIELQCVVKHVQSAVVENRLVPQFGFEFINPSQTLKNRMTSLTLEFQHRIVTRYMQG